MSNPIVREVTSMHERLFHEKCVDVLPSGCRIWMGAINPNGYGCLTIRQKNAKAHRVSWEWANGPIPENMNVLHRCDVPSCVNPEHLFLGSQAENMADMKAKGRAKGGTSKGESHGNAKITADTVRQIRALARSMSNAAIARKVGVHRTNVSLIVRGKAWSHV